jgi:hypothetical protein
MEELIQGILEKSLVGGAFLYLLYMFTTKFNVTLERIADTLVEVSKSLNNLDERVRKLEDEKK